MKISSKDGSKVMTVIASPGQGPDRSTEVSYTDTKVRFSFLIQIFQIFVIKKLFKIGFFYSLAILLKGVEFFIVITVDKKS